MSSRGGIIVVDHGAYAYGTEGISIQTEVQDYDTLEAALGAWKPIKGIYVVDVTHNNDETYIKMAKSIPQGGWDVWSQNCCHWARKVIEASQGSWPIPDAINKGANLGNPSASPKQAPTGFPEEWIDKVKMGPMYPPEPEVIMKPAQITVDEWWVE